MTTNLRKIEPEKDGVLKDGQSIRVRMTVMDAEVAAALADKFVGDHSSNRPHAAMLSDAQKAAAIERHTAADKKLSEAWRNPTPLYIPTIDQVNGEAILEVHRRVPSSDMTADALDALQADNQRRYNARIENAWRNPRSVEC